MRNGFFGLIAFWSLSLFFNFLVMLLEKKSKQQEEKYNEYYKVNGNNNYKKYSFEFLQTYIKQLKIGKWFFFIGGIIILIRAIYKI